MKKIYWSFIALAPVSALANDFQSGLSKAMGIGSLIAFAMCVFFVIEGIWEYRRGGNYGKDLVGLVVSAGAFVLVKVIFAAFGLGGAAVTPSF